MQYLTLPSNISFVMAQWVRVGLASANVKLSLSVDFCSDNDDELFNGDND